MSCKPLDNKKEATHENGRVLWPVFGSPQKQILVEANGEKEACGIPADYPYAELLDEFK